ncbi:MAG: hypothetical protein IIB77_08390 [Proteobacteria bacterium]|nr:hypothetical protein [Pseudomonadota bacterium]
MVAIGATILAGLLYPGIMVVIPLAIGVIYVVSAAGAIRDWRLLIWLACLMSVGVAVISTAAVSAIDFAVFQLSSGMGDPPMVAASPSLTGEVVILDSIPDAAIAEMHRIYASSVKMQKIRMALLLLVSIGSGAVVLMHGIAWRWVILGKTASKK